jgi:SAM-dependent methyltransferase
MATKRVLVTGATGRIGGAVAAQLLEKGVTTRAMVHRDDARSAEHTAPADSLDASAQQKRADMKDTQLHAQYSTGLSRHNIEQALRTAGKDLDHLRPTDLALLEDFHTMGRYATTQLVELIGITSESGVLDAGSGIGGTARFVADQCRCRVTAVDLTDEYCDTSRWLNRLVGLEKRISVRQADVTELPFTDATFDVVLSQHVQMNVADKQRLYQEARRVLVSGGRLAMWDITNGERGELDYPLPWADQPTGSHLTNPDRLRAVVESAGFAIDHWNDLTDQATAMMQTLVTLPPNPLGLHAFVTNFAQKAKNLTLALADGRLRAIQGIARAIT